MSIVFDICLEKTVCMKCQKWNESNNRWKIKLSLIAVGE